MVTIKNNKTKLGRFLYSKGLSQKWLKQVTSLDQIEVSRLYNKSKNKPNELSIAKVIIALKKEGLNVTFDDFWA